MGDHEAMFALLENYLRHLGIEHFDKLSAPQLDRIVFCGDGGEWMLRQAQHRFGTAWKSSVSA